MDWWNDLTEWTASNDGWRLISGAIIPFVAIVVAGVVAALIGRGATKRVVAMQEREARNAAVTAIVSAARKAATWGSLGHDERAYADHLAEDADIRLRLLPVAGAPLAANWTQHEIADIKKNSSTFSFQAEQSLAEFRDRLLEWQARPGRARKLFKSDLERWKFDSPDPDAALIARQQDWNADQAAATGSAAPTASTAPAAERPTPTTTSLRPAPQRPGGTTSPASSAAGAQTAPAGPAGTAAGAAAGAPAAGFSVTRGAGTAPAGRGTTAQADPNATTPLADHSGIGETTPISDANATRAYGDGATTPLTGASVRPTLGSPVSPSRNTASGTDATSTTGTDTSATGTSATSTGPDADNADAVDDTRGSGADRDPGTPNGTPTSADAHVNRASDANDRPGTPGAASTTSVPTRIAGAPAEPADADETSEAPYTQPISASELRRRAAEDDE